MKVLLIVVVLYESTFFRVGHSTTIVNEFSDYETCLKAKYLLEDEISKSEMKIDYKTIKCVKEEKSYEYEE